MRVLTTKEAVENFMRVLITSGKRVKSNNWQAQKGKTVGQFSMIEVNDLFVQMKMVSDKTELGLATKADLPWAEDHFCERISGVASNPGKQYINWPYWKVDANFMESGIFSHTYQERFWPPKNVGIRYKAGDLNDIVDRLIEDDTTRQAFLSIWHPEDQSNNNVRVPCTIGYWFSIRDFQFNVTYLIRSCDARRHLRNDVYMTQRLAQRIVGRLNESRKSFRELELGLMNMWVGSLHCFTSDVNYLIRK